MTRSRLRALIEWRATNGFKPPFARVADVVFVKGRLNQAAVDAVDLGVLVEH